MNAFASADIAVAASFQAARVMEPESFAAELLVAEPALFFAPAAEDSDEPPLEQPAMDDSIIAAARSEQPAFFKQFLNRISPFPHSDFETGP
jgi:hypothetical protein